MWGEELLADVLCVSWRPDVTMSLLGETGGGVPTTQCDPIRLYVHAKNIDASQPPKKVSSVDDER
jgi:hypothetical protein